MDTDTEEKPLGDGWAPCGETAARGADGQAPSTGDGQRSTRSLLSGPPHGSVTDLKTTKVSRKYKVQTVVKEPKWTQWTVQRAEMVTRGFLTEAPQPQMTVWASAAELIMPTEMWHIRALEHYSEVKEHEATPSAATRVDQEIIVLSETVSDKDNYAESKHDTNELTYKSETDSQTRRTDVWWPRARGVRRGMGAQGQQTRLGRTGWTNNRPLCTAQGAVFNIRLKPRGKECAYKHAFSSITLLFSGKPRNTVKQLKLQL